MKRASRMEHVLHGERVQMLSRRTFCLRAMGTLGMAGATLSGCAHPPAKRPNLVMLIMDTVRADHVSYAGYARRTTPRLDAFAEHATVFQRAYSTAPWTLPSHATLFTGLYSFQHGVEASLRKDAANNDEVVEPPLPDSALTLAESLKGGGYATAAFTANTAYMNTRSNFAQGFDHYDVQRRPGVEMVAPIAAWIRVQRDTPFFLFVNMMDAHYPYNTQPCPDIFSEDIPQDKTLVHKLLDAVLPGERPAPEGLVRDVTAQYDAGIANADYAVGLLLDQFRQLGVYEDTLIVVTSDHGEYLGEHLLAQHSKDVYEEALRVPLVVKHPGQRQGLRDERPVSLIQTYGTILDAAQVVRKPGLANLDSQAPLLAELHYSRPWDIANPVYGKRFKRLRTAYYEFPWKLIHSSDGKHELYHVEEDPQEARNCFSDKAEQGAAMLTRLGAIKPLSEAPPTLVPAPAPMTEQDREAMRANGYL